MSGAAQLALGFEVRPALGGADFLVAPANADAVAWLDKWPDWPAPAFVIFGPPGAGKTHLAHVFAARAGAQVLAGTALAGSNPVALAEGAPACIVDDADAADERALLALYNAAAEADRRLLLTAGSAPRAWGIDLADLRSRLLAAPAAALRLPDDALVKAVLVKHFSDRQLRVEPAIVDYLAARMERSFDAARRLAGAIDEAALAARREITLPLVREVLDGMGD